jgi:hypothetical protein
VYEDTVINFSTLEIGRDPKVAAFRVLFEMSAWRDVAHLCVTRPSLTTVNVL